MINEKEWLEYFEAVHGRKPSSTEYFAAKKAGEFVEEAAIEAQLESPMSNQSHSDGEWNRTASDSFQEKPISEQPAIWPLESPNNSAPVHVVDQRGQNVSFGRAIKDFFRGYFDFKGYTTRKGYWYVCLFNAICSSLLFTLLINPSIILTAFYYPTAFMSSYIWNLLLSFLWYIPGVSLTVRRLRDAGFKGWGIFWLFLPMVIPFVNAIVAIFIIYALCQGTEHFVKEKETFFFKGRDQVESFPDASLPREKSVGGFIGTSLLLVAFVATIVTTFMARNYYDASLSQDTTESYSSAGNVVDLSTYDISLYVDGMDGSGTARVVVNYHPYVSIADETISDFLANPNITLSQSTGLSNGDEVEVEITLDEDRAEELGLELTNSFYKYYEITSLEANDKDSNRDVSSGYWSDAKAKSLADYMVTFGQEMNQPNYVQIPTSANIYWLSGEKLDTTYTIVDAYEYWFADGTKVHRYFFAIKPDGSTSVLYSQDTNGERYHVKETANAELPSAFASIVASGNLEAEIESFMTSFRKDINRSIQESKDYVAPYFDSKENSTYQQIIDIYLSNPYHYARHESKTDRIYDIKQTGDQISFTIDFTTTTYFTDGTSPKTTSLSRYYELKRSGRSFHIISFNDV